MLQSCCQICHIPFPKAPPARGAKGTPSTLCLARSWFRGVPVFLKCLHGSCALLAGDFLNAYLVLKLDSPRKTTRAPKHSVPGHRYLDWWLLSSVGLCSRGFPLPVLADGKHLLGTSWVFLGPRNVCLKPSKTRDCGFWGRFDLELWMGFTASCPALLRALWLHSTGGVGAVQPPQTTCRSQSSIARENKYPCLPQKAEPLPAVQQELLGQLGEQVDRQRPHCGTVLFPVQPPPGV